MSGNRQRNKESKEEKKESKEAARARAHKEAEENAKGLQKAVASLIYQAETEAKERITRKEEQQLKVAALKAKDAKDAQIEAEKLLEEAQRELEEKKEEVGEVDEKKEEKKEVDEPALAKLKELAKQKRAEAEHEKSKASQLNLEAFNERKAIEVALDLSEEKQAKIKKREEEVKIALNIARERVEIAEALEAAVAAKIAATKAEKAANKAKVIAQRLELEVNVGEDDQKQERRDKAEIAKTAAEAIAKAAKVATSAAKAAAQEYNEEPPLIHPLTAYGYGTPGGGEFKKIIDKLQATVNDFTNELDEKKEAKKKEEEEEKEKKEEDELVSIGKEDKHEAKVESKAIAAEFKKSFTDFEKLVRDTQNSWMMGQPVEPEVLKAKAKELQAKLAKYESMGDSGKLEKIKEELADFPANVDRAVGDWQRRAQARVTSNASISVHRSMLTAEIKAAQAADRATAAKTYDLKRELGNCDILRMTDLEVQKLKNGQDPDFKQFKQLLNQDPASTRAFVLVDDGKGQLDRVVYINTSTKEIQDIDLTKQRGGTKNQLEEKLKEIHNTTARVYSKEEGFAWRSTLQVPTVTKKLDGTTEGSTVWTRLKSKLPSVLGGVPEEAVRLEPYHEKWIASIIGLTSDWKKTLPVAYGDPEGEMARRVLEEKECLELCHGNEEQAAEMARDKALERLEKNKDKDMEYDVGGDIFRVHRRKDDDGHMVFSVAYTGDTRTRLHGTNPDAMAHMVDLCYKYDPLSSVELDCEPLGGQSTRVLKKVEQQLEQAIKHAEELAKGNPPVYIGIEIGENAKAVLSALTSNKGLEGRAQALFAKWEEKVAKKHQDTQQVATQKYTASKEKESKLAALLASPLRVDEMGLSVEAGAQFDKALKTQGKEPADLDKKLDEVRMEVQNVNNRVRQLSMLNQSIKEQMRELEKELEQPKVKDSPTRLDEIAARLEGLMANRRVLENDLKKVAADKVVENYCEWIAHPDIVRALGVNREAKVKPVVVVPDGKTEQEVRKETPVLDEKCKAFEKREAYVKLVDQTVKAKDTANDAYKQSQDMEKAMTALKSKIDGFREVLKQEAVAGPEALPAEVPRRGMP